MDIIDHEGVIEMRTKLIAEDVQLGQNVVVSDFVNLYGCTIGDNTKIGPFVEIQKGVRIGQKCKISSHTFICEGVTIEDDVFVGHNVSFVNDRYPRATIGSRLQTASDWAIEATVVKRGASIGTGATILCGLVIGEEAMVGAGSVVTKDVPPKCIVAGNPARGTRQPDGVGENSTDKNLSAIGNRRSIVLPRQ